MGYGQKARGAITISPPLTAAELRQHPEYTRSENSAPRSGYHRDLYVVEERVVQQAGDGEIVTISASKIAVDSPDEEFSRYGIEDHLQEIINAFPASHAYTGRIMLTGEDGEQSALIVTSGTAREVYPKLTWPWDE